MCGRYASTKSSADLATLFDAIDETEGELAPDYNVAPTDPVPIVRLSARITEPVLSVARWGLVPAWSVDTRGAARMINARAETVASSRAFGRPFAERRCLVPADGWYEWRRRPDGSRQAYYMTREDGASLVFAGIWSAWSPPEGTDGLPGSAEGAGLVGSADGAGLVGSAGVADRHRILTFSVLTMPAEAHLTLVHDRMPLVLEPIHWTDWLTTREPTGLLRPPSPEYAAGIELRPVSPAVGNVRNDGPELIRPAPVTELGSTVDSTHPTLF